VAAWAGLLLQVRDGQLSVAALCAVMVSRVCPGRKFLTKINANIGNSAVSSSIEEVGGAGQFSHYVSSSFKRFFSLSFLFVCGVSFFLFFVFVVLFHVWFVELDGSKCTFKGDWHLGCVEARGFKKRGHRQQHSVQQHWGGA
jgi:hypothetical protein